MLRPVLVALLLVASTFGPPVVRVVHADEPTIASTTATLTVLSGLVQRVPAGASQAEVALDGTDLQAGDRVVTGAHDRALVTFLDGSTLSVEPATDIVVQQADIGGPGAGSTINIRINLGTVWARVVRLADFGSNFSLSSSTATAVVHDGLPGAESKPDGSFQCWTFAGEMIVTGTNQRTVVLQPNQTTTLPPTAADVNVRPIHLNRSTLRITATGAVLPLLETPDQVRVAGFVAPGLEVNQVFGSFTDSGEDTYVIEVPAGEAGPFTLMLEGQRDDAFTVDVEGFVDGNPAYAQQLSGTIGVGQRLITAIAQEFEPGPSASAPGTAIVRAGTATPLETLTDAPPGRILLSPMELESLASR
jgi:hypothetical protein